MRYIGRFRNNEKYKCCKLLISTNQNPDEKLVPYKQFYQYFFGKMSPVLLDRLKWLEVLIRTILIVDFENRFPKRVQQKRRSIWRLKKRCEYKCFTASTHKKVPPALPPALVLIETSGLMKGIYRSVKPFLLFFESTVGFREVETTVFDPASVFLSTH